MEAWQSWTIFGVAVAGAAFYYTTSGGQKKRGSGRKPFTPKQAQRRNASTARNESRDKRRKEREASGSDQTPDETPEAQSTSVGGRGTDNVKQRKGAKHQPSSKLAQSVVAESGSSPNAGAADGADDREEMDNLAFAKQLADTQTGTSLKKPDSTQNKQSRRQAKRAEAAAQANVPKTNGVLPLQESSAPSSTTGADADDDFSSTTSPEIHASDAATPSGADVSDMLEPAGKGPSILRLTSPANPPPERQPKVQKPAQEPETKKQRQARRKKEEQRAIREQEEKERRVKMENQRRTAREAEGRPAKNGLGTAQQPSKSVWTGVDKAGGNKDTMNMAPPLSNAPLLDTFEEDASAGRSQPVANASKPTSNGKPLGDLPSEEDQMKLLNEMESDNTWNTVSKGKSKKKGSSAQPAMTDAEPSKTDVSTKAPASESAFPKGAQGTSINAQANGVAKGATQPANTTGGRMKATRETIDHNVWNRSNIHEHPDYDPAYPYALTGHPDDSDWAVI